MTDPELVRQVLRLEKELKALKEQFSKFVAADTRIHLGRAQLITVAGGVLTPTAHTYFRVVPESGMSDEVNTITGTHAGQVLLLFALSGATITFKDGTGNIQLESGDVVLDGYKSLTVVYSAHLDAWMKVATGA